MENLGTVFAEWWEWNGINVLKIHEGNLND